MIHQTDLQMRFADTDALGHVNNVAYAAYAETGRVEFLHRLGKSVTSLILASITIDYRRQVQYGDRIRIDTWVEKLGRTSITLAQTLFANDRPSAEMRSVVVHFDYGSNKPMELTDDIRGQLEPFLRAGS
jgi:acyl-CoA thioester hydrolase